MEKILAPTPKLFDPGRTLITSAASDTLNYEDVSRAINRHISGDWGDVCPEDRRSNDRALKNGLRIFSVYEDRSGEKFWIITEADRSYTTVLLPDDY